MRMARLDPEARVAIRTLVSRGTSNSVIARLLDVTEGAVRYTLHGCVPAGLTAGRRR